MIKRKYYEMHYQFRRLGGIENLQRLTSGLPFGKRKSSGTIFLTCDCLSSVGVAGFALYSVNANVFNDMFRGSAPFPFWNAVGWVCGIPLTPFTAAASGILGVSEEAIFYSSWGNQCVKWLQLNQQTLGWVSLNIGILQRHGPNPPVSATVFFYTVHRPKSFVETALSWRGMTPLQQSFPHTLKPPTGTGAKLYLHCGGQRSR